MINIYKRNFNIRFFIYFAAVCVFISLFFLSISCFLNNLHTLTNATTSTHTFDVFIYVEDPDNLQSGFSQPSKDLVTVTISFSDEGEHVQTHSQTTVIHHHHYSASVTMDGPWLGTRTETYNYQISLNINQGYTEELAYHDISDLSGTKTIVTGASNGNDKGFIVIVYLYPANYNIDYNLDGGTLGENAPENARFDDTVEISNPTKTGNRFTGWTITNFSDTALTGLRLLGVLTWHAYDGDLTTRTYFTNLQTTDGETITMNAHWDPYTLNYTYNYNGGSGSINGGSAEYGDTITLPTPNARNGYTFKGWQLESDNTGTIYQAGDSYNVNNDISSSNASITFVALWETNQLIATLYYQDDETANTTTSSYYSSSSTKLGLPELSRTGYEFKGWSLTPNDTGVYYDADSNWNTVTVWDNNSSSNKCVATPNAGDIYFNLYAIWEANEYYVNVNIYNPNGVEEYTSNINGTFTLRDDEGNVITGLYNEPSDNYITFDKSWQVYDIVAGTGRKLKASSPVTCGSGLTMSESNGVYTFTCTGISDHTINIYMEYISYKIAFNGNGSTGGSMDTIENVKYDSDQKLTANGFTRAGYVFTGWNTKSDGTGTPYSDKATVKNLTIKDGDTVTLFAQWQSTIASGITEVYEDAGTYYINTADDLAKLIYTTESKAVGNGYIFILSANIDLSNLTYLPIGRLNSFSATYDGQGYTISGLSSYNGTDANDNYLETNGGLFANAGGAKIKNVIIENATIYGQNAGIIAGIGNEGTKISNCVVSGSVNGSTVGSIIGNGNGASIITACLAKGVNTASFAGGSASVDSCIYELTDGTKGASDSFNDYSAWIYPSNFGYPMPKAFMWYPYPELSEDSLNTWING